MMPLPIPVSRSICRTDSPMPRKRPIIASRSSFGAAAIELANSPPQSFFAISTASPSETALRLDEKAPL